MPKLVSEVVAALDQRIDPAQTKTVNKGGGSFTYVSWESAVRILDAVFGKENWSARSTSFTAYPSSGMYLASVDLTGRAVTEDGQVVEFTRPGFGRGIAQPSRVEQDQGLFVSRSLITHDTAAAAAGSDALSRATKLLGDAFGLFLYDKDDVANSPNSSSGSSTRGPASSTTPQASSRASSTTSGSEDRQFSPAQKTLLGKAGFSPEQVASLPYAAGKKAMDDYKNSGWQKVNPANYVTPTEEEYPF